MLIRRQKNHVGTSFLTKCRHTSFSPTFHGIEHIYERILHIKRICSSSTVSWNVLKNRADFWLLTIKVYDRLAQSVVLHFSSNRGFVSNDGGTYGCRTTTSQVLVWISVKSRFCVRDCRKPDSFWCLSDKLQGYRFSSPCGGPAWMRLDRLTGGGWRVWGRNASWGTAPFSKAISGGRPWVAKRPFFTCSCAVW